MASRSGQLLWKLPEPIAAFCGDRTRPEEGAQSTASPLERNPQSPKGWKKRESGGVGLGIVAALERTCSGERSTRSLAGAGNSHAATAPIAIGSPRAGGGRRSPAVEAADLRCGGGMCNAGGACERSPAVCRDARRKETEFYHGESPATTISAEESESFRIADFLDCCYLCRKKLHGKDIYMYRGEKAFCSADCRYQQMVSDEYQEKCGLGVRSTPEISSSPYSGAGQLFFTGIVVS